MNWFETYRLRWIAEMLDIYGFINREHLQRKFGISTPQASKDLQAFQQQHRGAVTYDLSRKCYVKARAAAPEGHVSENNKRSDETC